MIDFDHSYEPEIAAMRRRSRVLGWIMMIGNALGGCAFLYIAFRNLKYGGNFIFIPECLALAYFCIAYGAYRIGIRK